MTIDTTIDQYRDAVEGMDEIIERHMKSAMAEIQEEFGTSPDCISLDMRDCKILDKKYSWDVSESSSISMGGE